MDLNTFKKQYTTDRNAALPMFMKISALCWLEYAQKVSGGKFKPDIDRIMKFSDADENYCFDYGKKHTCINPSITVGELLSVANNLLSIKPDPPSEFEDVCCPEDFRDDPNNVPWEYPWDDIEDEPCDDTEDEPLDDTENEPAPDPQGDGIYIVNCLMVYPFTMREEQV